MSEETWAIFIGGTCRYEGETRLPGTFEATPPGKALDAQTIGAPIWFPLFCGGASFGPAGIDARGTGPTGGNAGKFDLLSP
jgi:hypothetical protein